MPPHTIPSSAPPLPPWLKGPRPVRTVVRRGPNTPPEPKGAVEARKWFAVRHRQNFSSQQLLAMARIAIGEVIERENGTYAGENGVEDWVRFANDLLFHLDKYFDRHARVYWGNRNHWYKWRNRWKHPYLIIAYEFRRRWYKTYTPLSNAEIAARGPYRWDVHPAASSGGNGAAASTASKGVRNDDNRETAGGE